MQLRWGILSAGKISQDFCAALQVLPKEEHAVTAVAARNIVDAQNLAHKYGAKNAYSDYGKLAEDPEVDIVYVGNLIVDHYACVKVLLEARKMVLCEKSLCMNTKQVAALVKLAQEKKVFFMEAIWFRCFPAIEQLRQELAKKTIGEVEQFIVSFGVKIANVDRLKRKELGGGATLDIGIYCVQLTSLVYGGEKPEKIVATGHLNELGVDESSTTAITFKGGRTATLIQSTRVDLPNEAIIVGNKGTIKIPFRFWCPTVLETPEQRYEFPLPKSDHIFNFHNSVALSYEAQHVRDCILKGLTESPLVPWKDSIYIAEIMESIRTQVGVHYPADDEEY